MASSAAPTAAVASLKSRHCFGALGSRAQGLFWADETTLAYQCGQSIALYQPDTKTQRFIPATATATITAFCVCPSRHLLAVAERGEKATITVFDLHTLKRRKILTSSSEGTKELVSVAFSDDGKLLLAQGGAPDWSLSMWAWERSKLLANVRTAIQPGHTAMQCLFQPGVDPQHISVVGEGTYCLYRIEDGHSLRPLPNLLAKREAQRYACHAWLRDNDTTEALVVVGTRSGEVLVSREGDIRQTAALQEGCGVESLAAFGKGFVVGTSGGTLLAFERDSESRPYRLARTFTIGSSGTVAIDCGRGEGGSASSAGDGGGPLPSAVHSTLDAAAPWAAAASSASSAGLGAAASRACSLAVSPVDDSVACLTSDNQLLALAVAAGDRRGTFIGVQRLAPSFHSGPVTGLATCVRRAVVATSGADRTIRIWNYRDKTAELVQEFEEDVLSMSLHPTGHMLLAGFADKLRLMMVLSDELRTIKELPIKASRDCCFSNGGQYFAAANSNTVHVYCAYTGTSLAVLRGHNGKVRGLWWSPDDSTLLSAGMEGAVYEWKVLEGRRVRDFVQKGWNHTCVSGMHAAGPSAAPSGTAAAGGPTSIFAAGMDKRLRALEDSEGGGGLVVAAEVDVGAVLTQIVAPGPGGRLLFSSAEDGTVRCYKLPLGPSSAGQALRCGTAPVTHLAGTRDESVLFAATADGCLHVLDVKDRDSIRFLSRKESELLPFAEEVLVGRGDIDERRERMRELESQVAEVTAQNEYQLKLRDLAANDKVRQLTDKAASEASEAAQRYNALLADRAQLESLYEARLAAAQKASAAQLMALDSEFQAKLVREMERLQDLAAENEALDKTWQGQTQALVEQHARVVAELTGAHQQQLAAEQARYGELAAAKDVAEREAAEVRRQMEEDVDREVEDLKERYRKQLQVEGDTSLQLKGENGLLRKRYDEQQKIIEEGKAQLRVADAERQQMLGTVEALERDAAALHRDVSGRDEAILEKEKRILDLKHKTQELEKFKFVLEYSLGELRAQLDPKDLELAEMRERVQGMEAQVAEVQRSHDKVRLEVEARRQREAAVQRDVVRQRAVAAEAGARIRHIQCDIQLAAEKIQAPEQLKAAVVKLLHTHAAAEDGKKAAEAATAAAQGGDESASDGSEALQRQVDMLQCTVERLRASLDAEKRSAAASHRRMVSEQSELIKQLRAAQGRGSGTSPLVCAGGNAKGQQNRAGSRAD